MYPFATFLLSIFSKYVFSNFFGTFYWLPQKHSNTIGEKKKKLFLKIFRLHAKENAEHYSRCGLGNLEHPSLFLLLQLNSLVNRKPASHCKCENSVLRKIKWKLTNSPPHRPFHRRQEQHQQQQPEPEGQPSTDVRWSKESLVWGDQKLHSFEQACNTSFSFSSLLLLRIESINWAEAPGNAKNT